jgi:HD-like signal output (HDOD) protein
MHGSMLYVVLITLLASSGIERACCLRRSASKVSQGEIDTLTARCTFDSHASLVTAVNFNLFRKFRNILCVVGYHRAGGGCMWASWRLPEDVDCIQHMQACTAAKVINLAASAVILHVRLMKVPKGNYIKPRQINQNRRRALRRLQPRFSAEPLLL